MSVQRHRLDIRRQNTALSPGFDSASVVVLIDAQVWCDWISIPGGGDGWHKLTVDEGGASILVMPMTSLNISLPQALKDYVESRVSAGGYSTPSEYLRELVRQDQRRQAEERLEGLLLDGLASGESIEITPEYWERKRQQLVERHSKRAEGG